MDSIRYIPQTENIAWHGGDTFPMKMKFKNPTTGDPIDLTGVVFKMQLRPCLGSPIVSLTFQENDNTIMHGEINELIFKKPLSVKGGNYVYDLQATYPDGTIITYMKGNFVIGQDVTN